MAYAPIDTKTSVDVALALIEQLKAMIVKMVLVEEAKRATLLAALSPSPSLNVLRSPSPSFPPPPPPVSDHLQEEVPY
jgi:hypothetical protein